MDGAIRLTAALLDGPQELMKLDLSLCGMSSHDITKICANISLIGGLLELNLWRKFHWPRGNESLEELHLAENVDMAPDRTLEYESDLPTCSENKMEVADNDDEEAAKDKAAGPNGNFASSSHRNPLAGSQFVQELSAAIESAMWLQLLDLIRCVIWCMVPV